MQGRGVKSTEAAEFHHTHGSTCIFALPSTFPPILPLSLSSFRCNDTWSAHTQSNSTNMWEAVTLSECITQTIRRVEWTDIGMRADNGLNDGGCRDTENVPRCCGDIKPYCTTHTLIDPSTQTWREAATQQTQALAVVDGEIMKTHRRTPWHRDV